MNNVDKETDEESSTERHEFTDIIQALKGGRVDTPESTGDAQLLRSLDTKLVVENERLLRELRHKQQVLERSEETIRSLMNAQLDSAMLVDPEGKILALNQMATLQLQQKVNEFVGCSLYSVLPSHLRKNRRQHIEQVFISGQPTQFEEHNQSAVFDVHMFPIQNSLDENCRIAIFIRDVTVERINRNKLRDANKQLKFMAMHDSLTGLANRVMLIEHLTRVVSSSKRRKQKFYVLFIDLDHFKKVNDSLGHSIGDILLLEVVHRIHEVVRTEDVVARVGGDEFVIVLDTCAGADRAVVVCNKINRVVAQKYVIANHDIFISASIGISTYPDDGENPSELLKNADFAMYAAKRNGKNTFKTFKDINQEKVRSAQ
jgi:diguanylate cyclase (GGDEF)-like protein